MTEHAFGQTQDSQILDENNEPYKIGSKELLAVRSGQANLISLKLAGGGELPDELKGQQFTNMRAVSEIVGNYFRDKQAKQDAKRTRNPARKPKEEPKAKEEVKTEE